jgi:hypothetical protein
MNIAISSAAASRKKRLTPRFALDLLRASLMTLVSIKYTRCPVLVFDALEILVPAHVRHLRQHLGESFPARLHQDRLEQNPVFGLCAATMPGRTALQCIHDSPIKFPDNEIGHDAAPLFAMQV